MGARKTSPFEAEDHQKDELPTRVSSNQSLAPPTPNKSASMEPGLHNEAPIKTSKSRASIGSAMDLMGLHRRAADLAVLPS